MNTTQECPILDPPVASFSSRQKQRIAIAQALVCGPAVVLADEPTAAFDGTSKREVVNSLQKLARKKNCQIVMATHDADVVAVADRITGYPEWMFTLCWRKPRFLCQSTHEMSPR